MCVCVREVRDAGDANATWNTRTTTRAWTRVSARVNLASLDFTVTTALTGRLDYCNSLSLSLSVLAVCPCKCHKPRYDSGL